MNAIFNAAAMAQLAQALGVSVHVDPGGDAGQFHVSTASDTRVCQKIWGINHLTFWLGFLEVEDVQKFAWLGLVELAAAAGYVDVTAWDQRVALTNAAKSFHTQVTESDTDANQVLVHSLIERLDAPAGIAATWDQAAFDAFESYLSLTRWVYAEEPLVDTLRVLH